MDVAVADVGIELADVSAYEPRVFLFFLGNGANYVIVSESAQMVAFYPPLNLRNDLRAKPCCAQFV